MNSVEMALAIREVGGRVGYGALDQLTNLKPDSSTEFVMIGALVFGAAQMVRILNHKIDETSIQIEQARPKNIEPQGNLGHNPNP